jgi:precorrin-2 dehydrogenase/sirohydrochlorin ferrochelatase
MHYYPIFLDLSAQPCLVIGGGTIAERKIESLLSAQGQVAVISPTLTPQLQTWAAEQQIRVQQRPYHTGDLQGFSVVFAATSDEALHHQIADEARAAGILLNVVDRPALCSFIVPAIVRQGDLTIAISTSGTSPAMAKKIRQELTIQFGPEYDLALQLLARVRERISQEQLSNEDRQRRFSTLVNSPLLDYLRHRQIDKLDSLLRQTLGEMYSLEKLAFSV